MFELRYVDENGNMVVVNDNEEGETFFYRFDDFDYACEIAKTLSYTFEAIIYIYDGDELVTKFDENGEEC